MAEQKTILLIDDDPDILETVKVVLQSAGHRVMTALDGSEGIKTFQSNKPDIIFCDMMMENIDAGAKVAHQIREMDTKVKIYLMSSVGDATQGQTDIHELGFNGYLQKPVSPDALLSIVGKA